MKTTLYTILLLMFNVLLRINAQSLMLSSVNANEQKPGYIKAFDSKYLNGKVYLHITVNNNTVTRTLVVERSLDASHFEVIGYIKCYGTSNPNDLAYYFTDESPVVANLYYRLSCNDDPDETVYGETINVVPAGENIVPSGYVVTPLYCYKN